MNNGNWLITDGDENVLYYSSDDVARPREVDSWKHLAGYNRLWNWLKGLFIR